MVAKRVGSGAAIAAGFAPAARDGDWNNPDNPDNHLPELLHASFQWMKPGATKVLWYEGYGVYNSTATCGQLVEAVRDLGYTITGDPTKPITSSLLDPYDILVIPQLQLPYPPSAGQPSGNPDDLPDADVQAINNWVNGGGGLFIMEATDFFDYKYSEVQNKVLLELGFDYLFQDDSVYDDTNNIADATYRAIVDVDETTEIGAAYQSLTGKTTIGMYGYCSLAQAGPGVSVKVVSDYQVGMPGTTLEYDVVVFNPKNPDAVDLTYDIFVSENADWSPSVSPTSLSVPIGENGTATLSVTIPTGTPLGTEDEILVTAITVGYPEVRGSFTCRAHAGLSIKPTVDAYVSNEENDKAYGADNPLPLYTGRYDAYWQNTYLQFDLPYTIPSEASITDARLFLFCFNVYGTQVPIVCTEVDDDDWDELTITWNNQPENGDILDQRLMRIGEEDFPISYSWDVTSFVDQEFQGDKIVSLCLRGLEDHPISVNESFESKDWPYEDRVHPILRVSYKVVERKVSVSISPNSKNGSPGDDVTFTVTVTNEGALDDSYSLTVTDTADWSPSISPSTLTLDADASDTATLTVTIPSGAADDATDTITVTATSQADSAVSASDTCTARAAAGVGEVDVTIDQASKDGKPGDDVIYSVTVRNAGTLDDSYSLTVTDTAGWSPSISPSTLTLDAGASGTATLTVTIPSDAAVDDSTTITVTASGTGYDDSINSTASVTKEEGLPMTLIAIVLVVVVVVVVVALILLRGRRAAPSWSG